MSIKLNYKVRGEGQPILILHGLFGSLDNWQTMAKLIAAKGFQVFTIDLRNHGKSPHTDEMNHQLMAKDVKEFIEAQALSNVILIGHSMGGKTAMQLSLIYPELIKKLIVVDIAPKPYLPHHTQYFDALSNLDLSLITSRSMAKDQLGESIKNTAVLQFLLKNLDRKQDGSYAWKFNLDALIANYSSLIGGIHGFQSFSKDTLFLNGGKSDYVSIGDYPQILHFFPQAKFATIDHAGHWVHAEAPEEFFNAIFSFIN